MQTTTIISTRSAMFSDGPRVVETTRGSAHRKIPTTRPFGTRPSQLGARRT
jgi:hypothetical protein